MRYPYKCRYCKREHKAEKNRVCPRCTRIRAWFYNMKKRTLSEGTFPIYDGVRWWHYVERLR